MRARHCLTALCLTALCLTAPCLGCMGSLDDPGPLRPGPDGLPGDPDLAGLPTCTDDGPVAAPLRRLSRQELDRTLEDLLGADLHDAVALELGALPEDSPWAPDGLATLTELHVEGMLDVADRAAGLLGASGARWRDLGAECMADPAADEACVRAFIEDFGRRAYRRPLTGEEASSLFDFYAEPGDHAEGAHRLVMRMLLAPELRFHVEIHGEDDGVALALDDYAVASRISYALTGSMPTDALLDAAEAGELSTPAQVEAAVRELSADPRARAHVGRFFNDWLRLDGVPLAPSYASAPYGVSPEELRASMLEELRGSLDEAVWDRGLSYQALLTSREITPGSDALAAIYEVSGGAELPPERPGLLLRAALLTHKGTRVAPIHRGVVIRRRILCDELPSPDDTVVSARLGELDGLDPATLSTRAQIERITSPEACQSCHREINGLAFALEEFDSVGRYRAMEEVYADDGTVVAEHPIDATATVVIAGREHTVGSAAELVDLLAESDQVAACLARTLYEYTRHRPASAEDSCAVSRAATVVRDGAPISELLIQNVADEATLSRRLEQ